MAIRLGWTTEKKRIAMRLYATFFSVFNPDFPITPSLMELLAIPLSPKVRGKWLVIPRRRESSNKTTRKADKARKLICFAGVFR
jgi:hypothetical protein